MWSHWPPSWMGEVLPKDPSSLWVMVTPSWCSKAVVEEAQEAPRDQSHSRCQRAHSQGSFPITPFLGCSKPHIIPTTVTTSMLTISGQQTGAPNIFMQWVKTPPDSPMAWNQTPPPRFPEIARFLQGNNTPGITIVLPSELTASSGLLVGTPMGMMTSMWLWQDAMMGITYIDSMTASMSLVSLGPTPIAFDHPVATLEVVLELEDWRQLLPYICPSFCRTVELLISYSYRLFCSMLFHLK